VPGEEGKKKEGEELRKELKRAKHQLKQYELKIKSIEEEQKHHVQFIFNADLSSSSTSSRSRASKRNRSTRFSLYSMQTRLMLLNLFLNLNPCPKEQDFYSYLFGFDK
jgi:hypothetical protein